MKIESITVKNLFRVFEQRLFPFYQETEIRQILYLLFEEYLGWTKSKVHLIYNTAMPEPEFPLFMNALDELYAGRPVQYILGKTWFDGMQMKVDRRVLIPRPETEELCALVNEKLAGREIRGASFLDIGTGSGCIAIDLKNRFPQSAVTAMDVSPEALEVASENARLNGSELEILLADILDPNDWPRFGVYDFIVSNPPYVTESDREYMKRHVTGQEPHLALFVPDNDPLKFYQAIAGFSKGHLAPGGYLFFEINERFGREVSRLFEDSGLSEVQIARDIHGKSRFITAVSGSA